MKLLIVSSAPFIYENEKAFAYSPYLDEMALWARHADKTAFCCPVWKRENGLLIKPVGFPFEKHFRLLDFNIISFPEKIKAFFFSFYNIVILFRAMLWADHIHLRCPGNIGLLASFVQIFFPRKTKTAKYAGNWDPEFRPPFSYRLQKSILENPVLSKRIKVLVYGEWPEMSTNVKAFFTATYSETEKLPLIELPQESVNFVFAGMLSKGKRPKYAIEMVQLLKKSGHNVQLSVYGEGNLKSYLEDYATKNNLTGIISFKGNQNRETLKNAYRKSHFVILPSESEGWPKVIAEGMFWGCIPVATPVSCVPYMLDYGKRGLLLRMNPENDAKQISELIADNQRFLQMRNNAVQWSRQFTTEIFESEIEKMLNP